jgi:hypothetical protein
MKRVKKKRAGDAPAPRLLSGEDRITSNDLNARIVECYSHGIIN